MSQVFFFLTAIGAISAALAVVMLLGVGVSAVSYGLALRLRSEEMLGALLGSITLPLMLLSGVLLPMTLAPRWLADLAEANPLSHIVKTERSLFGGDLFSAGTALGAALTVAILAAASVFGVRALRAED